MDVVLQNILVHIFVVLNCNPFWTDSAHNNTFGDNLLDYLQNILKLECGPMPNLMVALPNIGGALCSTPQSLADAHY